MRFYKGATNTGTHIGNLWNNTGTLLASATFTGETTSGWQQVNFTTPVAITANTTYVASYHTNAGNYSANGAYFVSSGVDNAPLHALASGVDGANGVYLYGGGGFPAQSYNATNYWVDVVFNSATGDTTPPTVTSVTPSNGATGVAVNTAVTATFSEAMTASTITASTVSLRDATNALVTSNVSYNTATNVVTLTPSAPLSPSTTYTATITGGSGGVKDLAGNPLAGNTVWPFTTAACPCTIWNASATPSIVTVNDPSAVELGVRFRSDQDGTISGVRFYKGATNMGTHIGNLWSSTGTLLASATFTGETTSGWQQVNFTTPVAITANTTYVASYHANAGNYSASGAYFASAGADNPPLHALATGIDGPNGVYAYGAGAFPNQSYNATNYWIDVVFSTGSVDTTPPTVMSVTPVAGATNVPLTTVVTATFSETMSLSSLNTTTFQLRDPAGSLVPASVTAGGQTPTATLTPSSPLAAATAYTVTVTTGARDVAGNALAAPYSWSFTTTAAAPTCPCTIWAPSETPAIIAVNDASAVELGVRFRSDQPGVITGVRFYKAGANVGTHVGSLWSSTGTLLATATFTNETASGWQQVSFATPIAIAANTTYIVSYHTNVGSYSVTGGYFATAGVDNAPLHALATGVDGGNGVYLYGSGGFPTQTYNATNYWVDVVYSPQ